MTVAVRVGDLAKSFGETQALVDVDLEMEEGRIFGLLGPNGAGKTTVIRILATLLEPDRGRAEVLGHDVVADAPRVRELIGLTGQFAAVDEILTGRENLRMFGRLFGLAPRLADRRADELLERLALADAADRPARTYSGGMRRRLDLASSLLTRPRVLFLDEPTTGLDPRSRNQIWDVVRELVASGTTLCLTTQYLEEADVLADRIAVVDRGRVIAEGTGDELKDQAGGATVTVRVPDPRERTRALDVLARVNGSPAEPGPLPDTVVLHAPSEGVALVGTVARALAAADVPVSDLALRRPTLDEVFLELTGERAAEAPADEEERQDGDGSAATHLAPPAAEPTRPPRGALRWVSDCVVVARRNLKHFVRQPQLLLFSTIQPVMFVLLFAFVFAGAIGQSLPPGTEYVDFLLPGIFVQSTAFRSTQTAVGLAEDLGRGVIDRFRSMPMARSAVLIGRSVADLARNVLVIALMIVVGHLVGFRFHEGPLEALGAVGVVALFGFALSWIFVLVALTVRGQEAVQSASFLGIFPLVFASSVFVPVDTMPAWLEWFASLSPVTVTADAARALAIGGATGGPVWQAVAWAVGLLAVFVPLSVWRYQRMS